MAYDKKMYSSLIVQNDLEVLGSFTFPTTVTSLTVSGATALNGTVGLGNATADTITIKGHSVASGTPNFDYSPSSGTFKTSTGTNTIGGDLVLAGDVSIDAGKDFDMSAGAGTFATGSGAVTLAGNTTVSGAGTFATGTGAVSLNGDVTVASGKDILLQGASTLTTGTGLTTTGGDLQIDGNNIVDAGGSAGITFDGAGNTSVDGNLTVVGTMTFDDASVTGDFDIQGEDLQATTGTLNISKSGSATTIKGTFNVDEAASFDTTVGVTGAASFDGAVTLGNAKADDIKFSGDVIGDGVTNADVDLSASSGAFTTTTGANVLSGNTSMTGAATFASGTGAVSLNGDVSIASGKDLDLSGGAGTVTTGTGAVSLAGTTTMAANIDLACAAGTTALDFALGTGAFTTSSGTNTFSGNVVVSGTKTVTTGTGAVAMNGDCTLEGTKKYFVRDTGIYLWSSADGTSDLVSDTIQNITCPTVNVVASTAILLDGDTTVNAAHTFSTGTGTTAIGGDMTLAGHKDGQTFMVNAFNCPNPGTDWTPSANGCSIGANLAAKTMWIPLPFLKIGDEVVSYQFVGDCTEGTALTLDAKFVRVNKADPITQTDVAGGGLTQIDAGGNFDQLVTLSAPETVATDKQYYLEVTSTTTGGDSIEVMGIELVVNRK